MWYYQHTDELYHHGIKGMKWGVRRYRNSDGSLTAAGKKRYLKDMYKDMDTHFKSQISKEAQKVTALGKNGYDNRGSAWNAAYRKGKVTNKDDAQIKKAAKNTREYAVEKYGKSAVQALARSNVLGRPIPDFDIAGSTEAKRVTTGKDAVKKLLDIDAVDNRKVPMTKADERYLRRQGKDPKDYEKVGTFAGTQYRKKGDVFKPGQI